jgi:hypothetical protein
MPAGRSNRQGQFGDVMSAGAMRCAVISECGRYRYLLSRDGDPSATRAPAVFIMLNPSTADAESDDPTTRRCRHFAQAWGCDGFKVVNLYAFRAIHPCELWAQSDPVGSENDNWIVRVTLAAEAVVCGWGANAKSSRIAEVVNLLTVRGIRLRCLGITKGGAPRHPLYVRSDQPLVDWNER